MTGQNTVENVVVEQLRFTGRPALTREADELSELMRQLSQRSFQSLTPADLHEILEDKSKQVLVVRDAAGRIIGTGTLVTIKQLVGPKHRIEDVVVLEEVRGLGIGKALTKALVEVAKSQGAKSVELTSSRPKAQQLYYDLGFRQRDTMTMTLQLQPS